MSTRERWIVYPLLFLAIGLGLRSGIYLSGIEQQNRLDIGMLQCNELRVVDEQGRPRIFIHTDNRDRSGVVDIIGAEGQVITSLRANEFSSALRLGSQRRRSELTVSNSGHQPSVTYHRSIGDRLIFGEALFLSPEAHRELVRVLGHLMRQQERSTPQSPGSESQEENDMETTQPDGDADPAAPPSS